MSGLFEHIEMFDEGDKVVTRQAIAVANKRFNDTFAGFLRQASSEKEFNGRLALVEQDIANMAADVANEYGGDAEKIAKAVNATVRAAFGPTPPADEAPMCENCGGHGCKDCTGDPEAAKVASKDRPEHLKAQDEVQLADEHSQVSPWLKKQIQDEDQEDGGNLRNKEAAAHKVEKKGDEFFVTEKGEGEVAGPFDSQEKAYARANELNDLENLETEETHKEAKGKCECWDGYKRVPGTKPCAPGSCEKCDNHSKKSATTPAMKRALELKQAASASKDEWVNEGDTVTDHGEKKKVEEIKQEGDHKVVELDDDSIEDIDDVRVAASTETGDKTEERESLPTGNEDAHDGPSPKIDKKKWKPNATNPDGNLKPIETEGDNSPHPTRHMDIKDKPDYQEDTFETVKKYDNKVWDREQLPTAKGDEAGFEGTRNIDQPTKAAETFPNKNQADPVTNISLPQALADKTSAWYDENSLFRSWLSDHGIALTDDPEELKESPAVRALWKQFVQDVPSPEEGEDVIGGPSEAPESIDEPVVEDIIDEEPIEEDVTIEETPEDIEEIIEREDDEDDRVKVIHDHDEEDDFEFEDSSDDEIEALIREMEENPDDWQ